MSYIPSGAGGPVFQDSGGKISNAHLNLAEQDVPGEMTTTEMYEVLVGIAKLLGCDLAALKAIGSATKGMKT